MTPLLAGLAALSLLLHLRAEYRGPHWQVYLFKPLTTALLLPVAGLSPSAHGHFYQRAVVIGLACSLIGDILLMLPQDRFIAGLASFLLAHLAYVAAFSSGIGLTSGPTLLLPLLVAAAILLRVLWPGLGTMRGPVVLYTGAILLMVWRAWAREQAMPGTGPLLAAIGAALFMTSDSVLALNRFRRPFRSAQAAIMLTYVAAQWLIAMSVRTP